MQKTNEFLKFFGSLLMINRIGKSNLIKSDLSPEAPRSWGTRGGPPCNHP